MSDSAPTLDFALGETAGAIRDTTQRFAADRIAPLAAGIDASNSFPRELWAPMGELGLHGITVEEGFVSPNVALASALPEQPAYGQVRQPVPLVRFLA